MGCGNVTTPFVRCVAEGVSYAVAPAFEALPAPPHDVEVDLPAAAVVALSKDPGDKAARDTVEACLRFTIGFMGFSYCKITDIGKVSLK